MIITIVITSLIYSTIHNYMKNIRTIKKCKEHLSLKFNDNLHENRSSFPTYHERCHMIDDHYYAIYNH